MFNFTYTNLHNYKQVKNNAVVWSLLHFSIGQVTIIILPLTVVLWFYMKNVIWLQFLMNLRLGTAWDYNEDIYHWKGSCWSWSSNTLATWCEELTDLKNPWCWQRLRAGGEGDYRGWDGWMALPTRLTWVWVDSGSWWWTGRPGVLWFTGSQSRTCLIDWTDWTEIVPKLSGWNNNHNFFCSQICNLGSRDCLSLVNAALAGWYNGDLRTHLRD